jgi:FtsH-binding integral membrane protein
MLTVWLALIVGQVAAIFIRSPLLSLALSVAQLAAFIVQTVFVVRMIRELRQRDDRRRP